MMHCGYFDITQKGNHSAILTPTVVGGRCPLPYEIYAQSSDLSLFETRQLRQIFAYNVSTKRGSEKSSIVASRKSATGFPTSYRWRTYITPKSPKGWLKVIFSFFGIKVNFNRIKSATKFLCVKTSSGKVVEQP